MGLIEDAKNFVTEKVANMPMPEAEIKDVDMKGFGMDGITFLVKVSVSNPYNVDIPIGEITYGFKSAEREIVTGTIPDPGSITAKADTVLEVTVKMPHSAVASLTRDIGADWDIDYLLEMGLIADLPAIGNITIPVSYKGEMKLPSVSDMLWGKSEESKEEEKEEENKEEKKFDE